MFGKEARAKPIALAREYIGLPDTPWLGQNYPNPFNSSTVIRFALPQRDQVELALYSLAGQKVATLAQGLREAGTYTLRWDGRDDDGRELASGVYLYRPTAGDRAATRTASAAPLNGLNSERFRAAQAYLVRQGFGEFDQYF